MTVVTGIRTLSTLLQALLLASCDAGVKSVGQAAEVPAYRESFIEVNGRTMHMKQWSFHGPAIVFFSGGGEDMGTWKDVIPEFTDNYSIFAVDPHGKGKSPASNATWKETAEAIVELIKKEFKEPVILVGHSFGAQMSAAVAAYHPKAVRAVVLEDPPGDISAIFPWLRGQLKIRAMPYDERVKHFIAIGRTEEKARAAATNVEKMDPVAIRNLVDGKLAFDIKEILPMIECEVLFMLGNPKKGSLAQAEYRTEFRKQIPHARISEWSESGHHLHSPDPERFVREIKEFLQGIQ